MMKTVLTNKQITGTLPVATPKMLVSSLKTVWHKSYSYNQFDTNIEIKGGNPS